MSEVKRFKITWDEAGFRYAVSAPLFEGAEVVRAEDYDALESKLSAVQAGADRLAEALKDTKKDRRKKR